VKEMTDDELPEGWAQASVTSLIGADGLFSDGDWVESKDQDPNGSIRLLQLADIGDGVFIDKSNRFINEEKFEALRCEEVLEGDVLIARMPDPLGRACLAPKLKQKSITVVDVAILRPGRLSVLPRWLMHSINSPQVRAHIEMESSGTTRKRIARGKLAEMELPIAPLAEQKRIADKLEAVLGRVDACRARLDRVPDLLKRFRQSVLAAATSGQLTEDWREGTCGRATVPLREAIKTIRTGPFGSSLHKADYVSGGTPIVNPMHINDGVITPTEGMTVDGATLKRLADFKLTSGDVIIGRRGEMGRCAVITENESGWLCGTGSMVLTPSAELDAKYLQIFLSSPETVQALEGESVGSTMVNLNQKILLDLELFYPPLPEQAEIVRRVEALFAMADRIEARLTAARAQVERLTPATLSKAFRGDLVPQDPNDEPASQLLERVTSNYAAGSIFKKRRKS
jgi:type I restriction enzyme S subunit